MSRVFDSAQIGANETNLLTPAKAVYNNLAAWTLAAWVYPTANDPFGAIFVKDPQVVYAIYLAVASLNLSCTTIYTPTQADSLSVDTLPLNQWSHIAATFNFAGDAKIRLYINGIEVTYAAQTAAVGAKANDSANGWMFGNDTFDDGFTGRIAEQAIWNTALTGVQVAALAASVTGAAAISPANLVGYWHECGLASPEPDATANGNDAVLSLNPPTAGPNSPGYTACGGSGPPSSNKQGIIYSPSQLGSGSYEPRSV